MPITTYTYANIYDALENIHTLGNERDEKIIYSYMARLRDMGHTPSKVVERATDWTERFLLAAHPEMGQVLSMPLAAWYVEKCAKDPRIGVHAGERRKEKEKEADATLSAD